MRDCDQFVFGKIFFDQGAEALYFDILSNTQDIRQLKPL